MLMALHIRVKVVVNISQIRLQLSLHVGQVCSKLINMLVCLCSDLDETCRFSSMTANCTDTLVYVIQRLRELLFQCINSRRGAWELDQCTKRVVLLGLRQFIELFL